MDPNERMREGPAPPACRALDCPSVKTGLRDQALACASERAGLACSAALGSRSDCLARTPCSIWSPRPLSTLRQYSNARCKTGSVTPLSRCPTMLSTSRSRAASSSTSRTSVPAWPQSSSSACRV